MTPIQLFLSTIVPASKYLPVPKLDKVASGLSGDQVRAKSPDAIRHAQLSRTDADRERIAAQRFQSLMTRERVIAETREAARKGLITHNGHYPVSLSPMPEQLFQISKAELGMRATSGTVQ